MNGLELVASPRPHVSHSQVSNLERCPMMWYQKYVLKQPDPQSIYMLCGSAYHRAMEFAHVQWHRRGGEWPVWPLVRDEFEGAFEDGIGQCYLLRGQDVEKLKGQSLTALQFYYSKHVKDKMTPGTCGPDSEGLLVEQTYVVPIFGSNYDFKAIVDLELADGSLVDYKLSGKKWDRAKIATGGKQATAYAFVKGRPETTLHFHVVTRKDKPELQCVTCHRTKDDVREYIEFLKSSIRLMEQLREGTVRPDLAEGSCSEYNCSYYTSCPKYRDRLEWAS